MKRIIPFLVCMLLGIGMGWYFGYTRPVAKRQRVLMNQYYYLRDVLHITDQQMAEGVPEVLQRIKDARMEFEMSAAIGLNGFKLLERGDTEGAKKYLLKFVGQHYRSSQNNKSANTNLLAKIEEAARKYPAVAAELSRKIE